MQDLERYLYNKKIARNENLGPIQEIVGGWGNVEKLAVVLRNHEDLFNLTKAALLLDFCNTLEFTQRELAFYRLGLGAMLKLMKECDDAVKGKALKEKVEKEMEGE